MKTSISTAFLLLSLFFAQGASAADLIYFWDSNIEEQMFNSPQESCSFTLSKYQSTYPNAYLQSLEARPNLNGTVWDCRIRRVNTAGNDVSVATSTIIRKGDKCPAGSTFNPLNGKCEGDPCLPTVGQIITHEHKYGLFGATPTEPPVTVCNNSCQYSNTWENQKCYRNFSDDKESGYCSFNYKGNGMSCTTSANPSPGSNFDQPPTKPPISPEPFSENSSKCDQWVTAADGTSTRACTNASEYKDPGKLDCSTSAGTLVCNPGSPPPKYADKTAESTETKATNPDGSKSEGTTTTTTTTVCKGAKPCTTTTKTETDSKGTNADGTPADSEQTCTGAGCDDDQTAEEEAKEEEEEEESTASGETCEASLACSGDAIQCAILRSQKQATCADELERDYDKVKANIQTQANGPGYALQEGTYDFSNMFDTGSRFLPAACPSPRSMHISSFNRTYQLSYEPICDFASTISNIVVAMAGLFFAIYVGRSFGGA